MEELKELMEKEGVKESARSEFVEQTRSFQYELRGLGHELDLEDIAQGLIAHARQWGGCVRCVHSRPSRYYIESEQKQGRNISIGTFWTIRTCVLGLSQGNCGKAYKPII